MEEASNAMALDGIIFEVCYRKLHVFWFLCHGVVNYGCAMLIHHSMKNMGFVSKE